jgi:hypothetical protein
MQVLGLRRILTLSLLFLALGCPNDRADPSSSTAPTSVDLPATCYLFSYFVGEKEGLHLAWSPDGLKWHPFMRGDQERIFLQPTVGRDKLLRDPCILLGPDHIFRMVWGDSWWDQSIGYASSPDLIHWSAQQTLPVMKNEPAARNCWAPEIHYDAASKRYLIFWSTTIPGRFPETENVTEDGLNHRIYLTTTTDFATYTPTTLFFDPKFCAIDATLLPFQDKFYLIFKNETLKPQPAKDLYLADSPAMMGPYTNITGPIPTQPAHWIEGPTAIEINGKVIIYYDGYLSGHFGACTSSDLRHWTDITPSLSMPPGCHHGTVIAVPSSVISQILAHP